MAHRGGGCAPGGEAIACQAQRHVCRPKATPLAPTFPRLLSPPPHPPVFRMYRATLAPLPALTGLGGSTGEAPEGEGEQQPRVKEEEEEEGAGGAGAAASDGDESDVDGSLTACAVRLRGYQVPPDPAQLGSWEVVAETLEEFEVRGRAGRGRGLVRGGARGRAGRAGSAWGAARDARASRPPSHPAHPATLAPTL